jgi:hypothetical protein
MTRSDEHEEWEQNNESFSYDLPEKPPDLWPRDHFTELYDRAIQRRVVWECRECSEPMPSLKDARRHVSNQHGPRLITQAKAKIEAEKKDDREDG